MSVNLQALLGLPNLTALIQEVAGGVPQLLPPSLFTLTRPVEGDSATYYKHSMTRQTASLTDYGGTARNRGHAGMTEVPIKLMHSLEVIRHKPHTLLNLLDTASPSNFGRQQMGMQEIARQTANFAMRFTNLRRAAVYSIFRDGKIYFDGDGNLLSSSSGAVRTVDFSVPAGNQNQLNALGEGNIIAASWATSSTDIVGQIDALRTAASKLTGLPIRHALYGPKVKNYLFRNDTLKDLIANNGSLNAAAAQGKVPDPLIDLTWWDVQGAFYADNGNVNRNFYGDDTIIFIPEPSREWWEIVEGTIPIAQVQNNLSGDAVAALSDATMAAGMFSLAHVTGPVPATIEHFGGDTFLPTLVNPNAIFIANVTP